MATMSYGFSRPEDIYAKLKRDGEKLTGKPEPDHVFNFLVTAVALHEWIAGAFSKHPLVLAVSQALDEENWEFLPEESKAWVVGRHCIPNPDIDVRIHVLNAMFLCGRAAGASKHFHWRKGGVRAVEPEPIVTDWYQYFNASVEEDLYFDFEGEVYGLMQIRDILDQFYGNLLSRLTSAGGTAG